MISRKRRLQAQAARARDGRAKKRVRTVIEISSDSESEGEVTSWAGGINNPVDDRRLPYFEEWDTSSDIEIIEMDGPELLASLERCVELEVAQLGQYPIADKENSNPSFYTKLCATNLTSKEWKKAESNRALGYNGHSSRTARRHNQEARKMAEADAITRKSKSANLMRSFLTPKTPISSSAVNERRTLTGEPPVSNSEDFEPPTPVAPAKIFTGYTSDISDDDNSVDEDPDSGIDGDIDADQGQMVPESNFPVRAAPAFKRRRHEVPVREMRKRKREERAKNLHDALLAIEKRISSKKKKTFDRGKEGLQAYRARAIQSHLNMVVCNGRQYLDASERAAEAQGFSKKWGGRLVRQWVGKWLSTRALPESERGQHVKVYSLLEDPAIRAELRSYLRSNKWSMDPAKLAAYTKDTSIPAAADKYIRNVVDEEMPAGLKKYMETELFPRIQYRTVGKGVCLETARQFLHKEGFRYTEHKKALYYDGHERPDVVEYRQNVFLPAMERYRERLIEFTAGNVDLEIIKTPRNLVERRLVMVAHDEMTVQQNDGKKKSWVLDGEHALKKKGVGRGLHVSGVICATVGLIEEAVQVIEYGKNYDGYWTGEMFVKQLEEKIIPAFERHHPGCQALFLIDNSQGHSAYAEDALLVSRMNMRPGGKQARMRNGWYMHNGEKVIQPMIFPPDHPKFPNQAKGMREVLTERNLFVNGLLMECNKEKGGCTSDECCATRILEHQPDFKEQKSRVQEVINNAGHLCIFLPKFHCELNYIEFFWGSVKRYLRTNCDYTFDGLKENLPKALQSVPLGTIRKWEHRMYRWMDAYRSGLSARDAQFKVKEFSSKKYTSHRRVPETLARQFD